MTLPPPTRPSPDPPAAGPHDPSRGPRRHRANERGRGQRGDYAVFIAVIATALLLLGGLAYDGPRLIAARQDAAHAANEAARVAAATIASGGTLQQARDAAENRVDRTSLIYGHDIDVAIIECEGSRVETTIVTGYIYRSVMGLARSLQPIVAVGAAEAVLLLPDGQTSTRHYLGECPLL